MTERCVLIVEDDPDSQYIYRMFFEHEGYRVVTARTGEEALVRTGEAQPDVILMDISIPGMDGWEVTRGLKKDPETSDIPVIAITAHAFPEDRERSRDAGCAGFLTKPCTPRAVLTEIRRILG